MSSTTGIHPETELFINFIRNHVNRRNFSIRGGGGINILIMHKSRKTFIPFLLLLPILLAGPLQFIRKEIGSTTSSCPPRNWMRRTEIFPDARVEFYNLMQYITTRIEKMQNNITKKKTPRAYTGRCQTRCESYLITNEIVFLSFE